MVREQREEVQQRQEPYFAPLFRSCLELEPLLEYPEVFSSDERPTREEVVKALGRSHPEILPAIFERLERGGEGNTVNPLEVNNLTPLISPALSAIWPSEIGPGRGDPFAVFAKDWLSSQEGFEYQDILRRVVGVMALLDIRKHEGIGDDSRKKTKREEAQRIFNIGRLVLSLVDRFTERPFDQGKTLGLLKKIMVPLEGESEELVKRKADSLWKSANEIRARKK